MCRLGIYRIESRPTPARSTGFRKGRRLTRIREPFSGPLVLFERIVQRNLSVSLRLLDTTTDYHALMADAEEVQELGRRGVALVKQWLEASTYVELNWNVYEDTAQCVLACLDGTTKKFDLAGAFIGNKRNPVVVESKNYTSPGSQHKYFKEFLAVAYSSTSQNIKHLNADVKREYIWVTSHPFYLSGWTKLTDEDTIREALAENTHLLGGDEVDESLLRKVAERVWVLVKNKKQEEISLPNEELMIVLAKLSRKAPTL